MLASAPVGLLQGELELGLLIRARDRPAAGPAAAEHAAEQVLESTSSNPWKPPKPPNRLIAGGLTDAPPWSPGVDPFVEVVGNPAEVLAETVILLPLVRIGQHLVGLTDLFELLGRSWIWVDVRVVLAGKFPVRLLDLLAARAPSNPERVVEVGRHPGSIRPRPADHNSPRPQLVSGRSVPGPNHPGHGVGLGVRILDDRDDLVAGGVEQDPGLLIARIAQRSEGLHGLVPRGEHALHDGRRVGLGVGEGQFQIVEHWKQTGSDPGPLGLTLPPELGRMTLPQVVDVGPRPQQPILQFGEVRLRRLLAGLSTGRLG